MQIRVALAFLFLFCLWAGSAAFAQSAPERIPLPIPRPDVTPSVSPKDKVEPKPRIYQTACGVVLSGKAIGKIVAPILEGQCGTQSPYQINAIQLKDHRVNLSRAATLNCSTATAMMAWVEKLNAFTFTKTGSNIEKINMGTSYACRRRNNLPTGKISEHGFANAIDVTGFELENGDKIELPQAWTTNGMSEQLIKQSHKIGCEIFTTTLGPQANSLHNDHLHLDMGCHGQTCTYKVCD